MELTVRFFTFKNNFLCNNPEKVEAQYNVIGYFDGLDIEAKRINTNDVNDELLSHIGDPARFTGNSGEKYSNYDMYCVTGFHEADDTDFWDSEVPIILISSMRFRKKIPDLSAVIQKIERLPDFVVRIYTTLDSSDAVICLRTNTLGEAYGKLIKLGEYLRPPQMNGSNYLKGFSSIAINREYIESLYKDDTDEIANEPIVSVQFRANGNGCNTPEEYWKKLREKIGKKADDPDCEEYGIFGSDDFGMMAHNVSERKLILQYAENGMLSHTNPEYHNVFFNIRTEIIPTASEDVRDV